MTDTKRLFIAFPIHHEIVLDKLNRAWDEIASGRPSQEARREEHPHLTLKFLGNTPTDAIPPLMAALHELTEYKAFTVALANLGTFHSPGSFHHSIHATLTGAMRLEKFREVLDARLRADGIDAPDSHPTFIPHITLGHVTGPSGMALPRITSASFNLASFYIYESANNTYTPVHKQPFMLKSER